MSGTPQRFEWAEWASLGECRACTYWGVIVAPGGDLTTAALGACRRYPPGTMTGEFRETPAGRLARAHWPVTDADDACGEWVPAG